MQKRVSSRDASAAEMAPVLFNNNLNLRFYETFPRTVEKQLSQHECYFSFLTE